MRTYFRAVDNGRWSLRRIIRCELCARETMMDISKVLLDGAQTCPICGHRHDLMPGESEQTQLMLGTAEGWYP
jgi:hypothetical protein